MQFLETVLPGAFIIDIERKSDERGFFARAYCSSEFSAQGLSSTIQQMNISRSTVKGTVRGLHFQAGSAAETKVVRCIRGSVFDVIVDLRPDSATYLTHLGIELSAETYRAVYVPKMFAHAYQALTDDAEVLYQVDAVYSPAHESGLRYDDPALKIAWPVPVTVVSNKDRAWPLIERR